MFGINKKITSSVYYPLLSSEEMNGGFVSLEEDKEIWKQFLLLDESKKNFLASDELPEKIKELQQIFHCDDTQIEGTSVLIRWLFFGEVDEMGFQAGLQDIFGEQSTKVFDFIQKEILTLKPKPKVEEVSPEEVKPQAVTVRLPLLQALSKYEQLGNQLVTRERIKIKSQPDPVRPSLLYWIKYYRDELGIGHHDSVQRGNFLFRSENGRRLSPEERERVNLVLKSVEENMPLEIDTEKSEIVFPVFEVPSSARSSQAAPQTFESAPKRVMAPASPTNPAFSFGRGSMAQGAASVPSTPAPTSLPQSGGEMSFSSKHVFPAEKQGVASRSAVPITPASSVNIPTGAQTVPRANPFRIRPVSLGQEE